MLHPCAACGSPVRPESPTCPHCAGAPGGGVSAAALLLGLALAGCKFGGKDETDFAQPAYGDALVDEDGDGWDESADCDDNDAAVHPDAKEQKGDGVDSNCDGDDDT